MPDCGDFCGYSCCDSLGALCFHLNVAVMLHCISHSLPERHAGSYFWVSPQGRHKRMGNLSLQKASTDWLAPSLCRMPIRHRHFMECGRHLFGRLDRAIFPVIIPRTHRLRSHTPPCAAAGPFQTCGDITVLPGGIYPGRQLERALN